MRPGVRPPGTIDEIPNFLTFVMQRRLVLRTFAAGSLGLPVGQLSDLNGHACYEGNYGEGSAILRHPVHASAASATQLMTTLPQ